MTTTIHFLRTPAALLLAIAAASAVSAPVARAHRAEHLRRRRRSACR